MPSYMPDTPSQAGQDMSSIPLKNPAEEGDERVELEQETEPVMTHDSATTPNWAVVDL